MVYQAEPETSEASQTILDVRIVALPQMIPSPKTFRRQEEYPNGISLFAS